ncbi:MAG: alpha/beta fold hydrolase [Steroidobacteraceae bacterium]
MNPGVVIFSHGLDSAPWGGKITALAEAARARGYRTESVDYRGMDDPLARVRKLLEFGHTQPRAVLVGSSLGGHVATAASVELKARGLFLMAPAFYMPGYEQYTPKPAACPISIVHGWQDDVVPVANSIRYAREHAATLQVIDADHRMLQHIKPIVAYFELFLNALDSLYESSLGA